MIALSLLVAASLQTTGFVAGWEMMKGSGGECGAAAKFVDDSLFMVFLLPGQKNARVSIGNTAWRSIREGQTYNLVVRFKGKPVQVTGRGSEQNGVHSILIDVDRGSVIRSMFMRDTIGFEVEGVKLFAMTPQSNDPVYALTQCAKGANDPLAR
ncbi:hypothetical protein [Sphingobium sp. MK2]|uniref:hypothetical protein n=1 Tax=Sphingobium sp. MK2 TaxID=3116540 RepID=UPI0032E3602A